MRNFFQTVAFLLLIVLATHPLFVRADSPATTTTSNLTVVPAGGDGANIGTSDSNQKVAFFGATPIVKRTDASQVAITDNTGGSVSDTLSTSCGVYLLSIPIRLAGITGNTTVVNFPLRHAYKILSVDFVVTDAVTTGSKAATLTPFIADVAVTGGVVTLSGTYALGASQLGTAITATNTGTGANYLSFKSTSVTAFAEGSGCLMVKVKNMDTANALASIADKWNEVRTSLLNYGLWAGL